MWYDPFIQGLGPVFGVPALIGTGFFLFRLLVAGAGLADGHIADHTAHADASHPHAPHDIQKNGHAGLLDGWLTFQSAFSWLMGFGWSGLTGYAVLGLGPALSAAIGVAGGVAMAWLTRAMLRGMRRFESDGTIAIDRCLGQEGEVYLTIPGRSLGANPPSMSGQVRVVVDGKARIYNAVARDEALIATGSRVLVVATHPDNSLIVQAI